MRFKLHIWDCPLDLKRAYENLMTFFSYIPFSNCCIQIFMIYSFPISGNHYVIDLRSWFKAQTVTQSIVILCFRVTVRRKPLDLCWPLLTVWSCWDLYSEVWPKKGVSYITNISNHVVVNYREIHKFLHLLGFLIIE